VAKNNGAEVVVEVAFDPPLTVRGRGAAYVEEMKVELHEEARSLAEESVTLLESQGVTARGVVIRGDVARGILETAEEEAVDMIIIGRQGVTHEMGDALDKFRALMSGGIAEKVSRHATVPVLMVV
jgi:nucleotide-binding universal stress UspA family protein